MQYDFVLGLQTILEYDLLPALRKFLLQHVRPTQSTDASSSLLASSASTLLASSLDLAEEDATSSASTFLSKELFFGNGAADVDGTEDILGISDVLPETNPTTPEGMMEFEIDIDSDDANLPPMMGDTAFHHRIRDLCHEFRDIFSRTVTATPADVPAFRLDVDKDQWFQKASCRGPRPQPPVRRKEISRQIQQMLDLGIIRRANDVGHYSQVLLVPKPHSSKWRLCIDYRLLNSVTRINAGHPLPHIPSMIQRVGSQRFKFAGKMDACSGYHQALMHPDTADLAAFVCEDGVYAPVRLMFGMRAAPSYFQGVMSTKVLCDLLHRICELYIDDVITWGKDEDEFLSNLRSIFARLREKNVKINPDKCELGVTQLEFVGHVVDCNGVTMSDENIRKVLDFPLPDNVKALRSFVGLCNYFSDHLRDSSLLLRPLHKSIARHSAGLSKRRAAQTTLDWLPEEKEAFYALKSAIEECTTLFFIDDTAEIFLATDACDHGIGAYLFQVIDGKERPIRFMSHSLSDVECRWSTIEKECYAIFRAFTDMAYLLRDRSFHLLTDHRNLTFLAKPSGSKATSEKVTRWRLAIQDYDFDIAHISGARNIVADNFSRLVGKTVCTDAHDSGLLSTSLKGPLAVNAVEVLVAEALPEDCRETIAQFHNELVGHFGVARTVDMLRAAGHSWKHMRRHVEAFCKNCPLCQKLSFQRPEVTALPSTTGGELRPMRRLCVDTLDVVETAEGYKYVLCVMDSFTRWVELYPLKTLEASEAADCFIDFFGRYGVATELLSDRGSQFVNGIIDSILNAVGTQHVLSLAYSKEENGRVERANREILRHLRAFIMNSKVTDDWVKKLPFVQRIMNSSVHSLTGFTPAALLFGTAVNLSRTILPQSTTVSEKEIALPSVTATAGNAPDSQFFSTWLAQRNEVQQQVLQASAELQGTKLQEHLASVSAQEVTRFDAGDWVLAMPYNNPLTGRRAAGDKLSSFWEGPFQVISSSGNTYRLRDTVQDREIQRHVTELKRFFFDPQHTDPEVVAQIDRREFVIEAVLDHRGDLKRKKTLEFLVRWKGYSKDFDLWLPWKEVMYTSQLRTYLAQHELLKLLPRSARK